MFQNIKVFKEVFIKIKIGFLVFLLFGIGCTDQRHNCTRSLTFGESSPYNNCRLFFLPGVVSASNYKNKDPNYDILSNPFLDTALVNCLNAKKQMDHCNKESKYIPVFERIQ